MAPSRHVEAGKDEGRAGTSKGKSGMLKPGRLFFFLRCWLLGVDSHFFPPQPRWAGGFGEDNHARQGCDLLCCSHSGAELAETQILKLGVSFCSDPAVARGCAQRGSCLRNGVRKRQTRICCCTEPLPAAGRRFWGAGLGGWGSVWVLWSWVFGSGRFPLQDGQPWEREGRCEGFHLHLQCLELLLVFLLLQFLLELLQRGLGAHLVLHPQRQLDPCGVRDARLSPPGRSTRCIQRLSKPSVAAGLAGPSCGQMPSPTSRCVAGTRISRLCAPPSNWRGRSCPA